MQDCSVFNAKFMIFKLEWCKLKLGGVMGTAPYKVWEVMAHQVLKWG